LLASKLDFDLALIHNLDMKHAATATPDDETRNVTRSQDPGDQGKPAHATIPPCVLNTMKTSLSLRPFCPLICVRQSSTSIALRERPTTLRTRAMHPTPTGSRRWRNTAPPCRP